MSDHSLKLLEDVRLLTRFNVIVPFLRENGLNPVPTPELAARIRKLGDEELHVLHDVATFGVMCQLETERLAHP